MPLRIAHIGAGEWSRFAHGPTLRRLAQEGVVSLESICDLQLDRAHQFRHLFHYRHATDNLHEMLAEARPDAIVCAIAPPATAGLVHSLLPLRVPLFIEKPPGISLDEAVSLASASASTGTLTFVAFNRRAIPSILRLKQWSADHPVHFGRVEMLRTGRLEPRFAIETGIHALDAIRFLMGDPVSMETRVHQSSACCDYSVRMEFENAATAELVLIPNSGLRRESYLLFSAGGAVEATLTPPYSSPLCHLGDSEWSGEKLIAQNPPTNDDLVDGGFIGEYRQFFRSLTEGKPSTCSLSDAARSMQLAEAVQNGFSGRLPPLPFR
ncbi:MAG: Gfo/Idh/MocA family oxidoreductase [Acidobacteria bacterium]|nr:Gfo/Idh/MocA family oxidoreductase [Acidobacteriota bacterium]